MIGRRNTLIVIVVAFALTLGGCTPFLLDYGPQPRVKWRVRVGSSPNTAISAPVAVSSGLLFVPAIERPEGSQLFGEVAYVQGLDVRDGRFLWHSQVAGYAVARPAAAGDIVYFASNRGRLYAANAVDGQVRWSIPVWDYTSMPVASGAEVFISSSGDVGSPGPGSIMALDAGTGVDRWQARPRFPLPLAPYVADDIVFAATGEGLLALNRATGKERWRFPIEYGANTAAAVDAGTVYVAGIDTLFAIDPQTGEERWHYKPQVAHGNIGGLFIRDGAAYLVLNYRPPEGWPAGTLIAYDTSRQREMWRIEERVVFNTQPAEAGGRLFVTAFDNLFAVDTGTGRLLWRTRIGPLLTDPVVVDGVVYVGDSRGDLTALLIPQGNQ